MPRIIPAPAHFAPAVHTARRGRRGREAGRDGTAVAIVRTGCESSQEPALTHERHRPTVPPPEGHGVGSPPAPLEVGGGMDASRRPRATAPRHVRPIAPGNGSGSPPPWDLDRSGGLFFAAGQEAAIWRRGYDDGMPLQVSPPGAERIIRWIMLGIVIWGVFHAFGAWRLNHDPRRMLVVLGCVAAFLGFWLVMLASWRRRHARP